LVVQAEAEQVELLQVELQVPLTQVVVGVGVAMLPLL
jgi:hypothetical protein